ncbi:MAG: C4-type zinc ribbon domain-containing protein [Propionibacteriaceae bacterium]|nr:C4-type zinc ribbon domain-containing protein [Propionibacteriaceae bacterium]
MLAEPSAQLRLLDLAAADTEIAQLMHRRKMLPVHAEIARLAESRKRVTAQLVAATTQVSDAQYELDKIERDIDPIRVRVERDQERLDQGAVTDPKVVERLVAEVAKMRLRLSDLEDAQLEAMQAVEDAIERRKKIEAARDSGDAELRELMGQRDRAVAKLDAEVADRSAEREILAGEIPEDLLAAYEKTRTRTGLGAAKLHQGRCSGCGLELNPGELRRIRAALSNEVLRCEECGRILIRTAGSGL